MTIWIIFGVFMLLSWLVGNQLKRKFEKFSKIPVENGMSGHDVALKNAVRQRHY